MQKKFVFLQPFLSLGKDEGQPCNFPLIINKLQDCFMEKLACGEGMAMLPGEDLTTFLKRNGYEI